MSRRRKRPKPSFGEGWSPEQFDAFTRNAKQGLEQLANLLRVINVARVAAPTWEQVLALRMFEPFENQNLVSIRRALAEGPVRVGPFAEKVAARVAATVLAPLGLHCRLVPVAPDDLS